MSTPSCAHAVNSKLFPAAAHGRDVAVERLPSLGVNIDAKDHVSTPFRGTTAAAQVEGQVNAHAKSHSLSPWRRVPNRESWSRPQRSTAATEWGMEQATAGLVTDLEAADSIAVWRRVKAHMHRRRALCCRLVPASAGGQAS